MHRGRSVATDGPSSGMNKRHVVSQAERERAALRRRVSAGQGRSRELLHARILLKTDQGPNSPAWTDAAIAQALEVSVSTVERVRNGAAARGATGGPLHAEALKRLYSSHDG